MPYAVNEKGGWRWIDGAGDVKDSETFSQSQPLEPAPAETYRDKRKQAYIEQLGSGNPTFEETTGDVLDAIIKHIYGDTTELDEMAAKIAAIKAANPKPQ
jgi:hypothetical protein